jgi:hypothetical protein
MEPSNYCAAPINEVLNFFRIIDLINGYSKENHSRSSKVALQGLDYYGPPLIQSFIHIFECQSVVSTVILHTTLDLNDSFEWCSGCGCVEGCCQHSDVTQDLGVGQLLLNWALATFKWQAYVNKVMLHRALDRFF